MKTSKLINSYPLHFLFLNHSKMFPSTSSNTLPQDLIANLNYPRRLLLNTPLYHLKPISPAPSPNYQFNLSSHGSFKANLIMIISVLLSALICSLCVNSLIRCMIKCSGFIMQSEPNQSQFNMINHKATRSGLEKKALRTFPMVKYSKELKIQGSTIDIECVICLSEFIIGEKLRVLPKCSHGFHVKCIDKWLSSHTSCPTCRQSLIDTCQKIIGCNDHQTISTSPIIVTSIAPLEREDLVRSSR